MREQNIDIKKLNILSWRRAKEVARLHLFDLQDGSSWTTRAAIIASKKQGPVVTVVAGQHGDELNGIFVAHRLFEEVELQDLTGTLVILPIANPFSFLQKSRVSVLDQIDMNRSYDVPSERHPTSLAGAMLFEEIFSKSNFVIDIHSGGPGSYLPNVGVVEQGRFELASYFNTGSVVLVHRDHGTLIGASERHSVPAFSLQVGQSLDIDYETCERMVDGLMNFFRGVDLIPEDTKTLDNQKLFTEKKLVVAPEGGFVTLDVSLGDPVETGQRIGEVEPLFGEPIEIVAPGDGHVIYIRKEPIISRGDSIVHLVRRGSSER